MALADRARFVFPCHVVVEIQSLGWRGHQRIVHWRRYFKIAGDRPALKLYLEHMSDGVVCNRFQTRGGNELSSHGIKDYLRCGNSFKPKMQLAIVMSVLCAVARSGGAE